LEQLSLVRQFALMASIVVGSGMVVLGSFVSAEIEDNVVHNAAVTTGLYVNSLNETYLQELTTGSELSEDSQRGLDASFTDSDLGRQIMSAKIWLPNGHVAYSTRRDLIGTTISTNPNLQKALKGEVAAQFGAPLDDADSIIHGLNEPMLKFYIPIHGKGSDRITAVAEFLTSATALKGELGAARLRSWVAVGGVGLLQIILLYGIVSRGNKTIESQRAVLVDARRASVETNERFLRRVGADLHDGPAQLISLALLRLDGLRPLLATKHSKSDEFEKIRAVLQDCLREIRHLSAGLAPPHLDSLPLRKVLELAVRQHEQRTGTTVNASIGTLPASISPLHKVSIYRFVQEGLNNAFRHAAGAGQTVHVAGTADELSIEVTDSGPGFSSSSVGTGDGLGLAGLRDRIESLGGKFSLETELGSGTRVRASFQVADNGERDA
jgi:signal transduction histidine kinase